MVTHCFHHASGTIFEKSVLDPELSSAKNVCELSS
jgi:hypothetical protein